jgi:hypothetical protein
MALRRIGAFCLAFAIFTMPSLADSFSDSQPFYTKVGQTCGTGASQRVYSKAEYTSAMASANRALQEAKGNAGRTTAIKQSISNMKDCQKDGAVTPPPPPPKLGCNEIARDFLMYKAVTGPSAVESGAITQKEDAKILDDYRKGIVDCLRKQKCVDPNQTSAVDAFLGLMEAAQSAGLFTLAKADPGPKSNLVLTLPIGKNGLKVSFCTETDFSCKSSKSQASCASRIARLGGILKN